MEVCTTKPHFDDFKSVCSICVAIIFQFERSQTDRNWWRTTRLKMVSKHPLTVRFRYLVTKSEQHTGRALTMAVRVDTVTSDPIPALEPKHTCRSHTIVLRNSRRFRTKHTFTATTTRPLSLLSSNPGGFTHLWSYYPMQNRQTQKRTHTAQATSYKIRKRKNDQKNKRRKWRIDVNIDGNRSLSKLVITLCTSTEAWVG